jgi:hypothetical protein
MRMLGARPHYSGPVVAYTYQFNIGSSNPAGAGLIGVRHLAVLGSGGLAAAAGADVPTRDVINLLQGNHSARSLASDPAIRQTLGLLQGSDVMLLGTALIISWKQVVGAHASAVAAAQLVHREPGLDTLVAGPTFVGYGYRPGNPAHATALAVAIYPSASDATAAARILGNVLHSGYSSRLNQQYAQLFAVDTITVHGSAVVARITARKSWTLSQDVQEGDFPLFWSPPT